MTFASLPDLAENDPRVYFLADYDPLNRVHKNRSSGQRTGGNET